MARTRTRSKSGTASVASAEGGGLATQSSPESAVAPRGPQSPSAPATPASRPAPRVYTQEERERVHADVCELIAAGASGMAACEAVGVPRATWASWVLDGTVDANSYARAREMCADVHGEGIVEAAEKWMLVDPAAARVLVDAKKWTAARMFPRRWGEKLDVTSNGKEISPIAALPAVVLVQDKLVQAEQAEVLGIADLPRLPAE